MFRSTFIVYVMIASFGCATILSDNYKMVSVTGTGPITVDGQLVGQGAPGRATDLRVSAHRSHVIAVGDRSCQLDPSVGGGWILLDLLVSGLLFVPLLVDGVTGEWSTIDPSDCAL